MMDNDKIYISVPKMIVTDMENAVLKAAVTNSHSEEYTLAV